MQKSLKALLVLATVVFLSTSCSGSNQASMSRPAKTTAHEYLLGTADELLPAETAADWATQADQVVLVHLASQRLLSPSAEEIEAGEGFMPRVLTFSVQKTLWSRVEGSKSPKEFELQLDGVEFKDGEKSPVLFGGEPTFTSGADYLMPIVYFQEGEMGMPGGWSNLSIGAIIPVSSEGIMGRGDEIVGGEVAMTPFVKSLSGLPVSSIGEVLSLAERSN